MVVHGEIDIKSKQIGKHMVIMTFVYDQPCVSSHSRQDFFFPVFPCLFVETLL